MSLASRLARLEARLRPRPKRRAVEGELTFTEALHKVYGPPGAPVPDEPVTMEEFERVLREVFKDYQTKK